MNMKKIKYHCFDLVNNHSVKYYFIMGLLLPLSILFLTHSLFLTVLTWCLHFGGIYFAKVYMKETKLEYERDINMAFVSYKQGNNVNLSHIDDPLACQIVRMALVVKVLEDLHNKLDY